MRRAVVCFLGGFVSLGVAWAQPDPTWRAPDPWSLHPQRLMTRALFEQLEAPEQSHRFLRGERVVGAADTTVSTALPWEGDELPPWHGYYTLDMRAAARLVDGLDLNLEMVLAQRSASKGYHRAAMTSPGVAAHWYGAAPEVMGRPARVDLVGLELGELTVGHGLFIERLHGEGIMGRAAWGAWSFEHFTAGEASYAADDLSSTRLSWGALSLDWLAWAQDGRDFTVHYLSFSGDWPQIAPDCRVGFELAGRLPHAGRDLPLAGAGLVRLDWLPERLTWYPGALHVGYQGRVYQQGVSPWGDAVVGARDAPGFPWREDTYVTNGLDYLTPSAFYHQWSHTLMLEVITRLGAYATVDLNLEGRAWFFHDPSGLRRELPRAGDLGGRERSIMPDPQLDTHARVWLSIYPFQRSPHRLRVGATNTFSRIEVGYEGDYAPLLPTSSRLDLREWVVSFEMELFL